MLLVIIKSKNTQQISSLLVCEDAVRTPKRIYIAHRVCGIVALVLLLTEQKLCDIRQRTFLGQFSQPI